MKRRFPSKPPPTRREAPWRHKRDVAPDMDKPKLEGESNTDFLLRCYAEDPRFDCSSGFACIVDKEIPPLPEWRRKLNEKKRRGGFDNQSQDV